MGEIRIGMMTRHKGTQDPRLVRTVTIRMWPNEADALIRVSKLERLSRSQVLRRAFEAYAKSALSAAEYRSFYPEQ
jgi:hypothetical protein